MRMLIIGPPGSGKGTQAERISEHLGVVTISTGDIFRAHVKGETFLGVEAKKYMDAGDFVPDSVTNKMVRDRLNEADVEKGFLLDGYPRITSQVDYLDEILAKSHERLDVVLQLTADDEELVQRLLGRAKKSGRSDDNEAVIRHRLDLYHEQTEPVVTRYTERGILTQVNGIGAIDEVTDRLLGAVSNLKSTLRFNTIMRTSQEGLASAMNQPLNLCCCMGDQRQLPESNLIQENGRQLKGALDACIPS